MTDHDAEISDVESSDVESSGVESGGADIADTDDAAPRKDLSTAARLPASPAGLNERLLFALRQAGFLAVALVIAGLVTERLRPDEVLDRGIASTTFLWAIVGWLAVLLLNAIAFERSQIAVLEGKPLIGALGIGAVVFIVGLVNLSGSSFGRRLIYIFANTLGAVMFWWALLSIAALVMLRLTRDEGF